MTTHHLALVEIGQVRLPVQRHWRLNECHYGALQGLDKTATTQLHGAEQTHLWRRSYDYRRAGGDRQPAAPDQRSPLPAPAARRAAGDRRPSSRHVT